MLKKCSVALAIALMGAVLVGCGKKEPPKPPPGGSATDAIKKVGETAPATNNAGTDETQQSGPVKVQVVESWIGNDGSRGTQQICVKYKVTNVSKVEYIGRLNWIEMDIHGVNEGSTNDYTRKENINYTFNPALEPGQSKTLTTKFNRKVNWDRGWIPYNYVEIKIKNFGFDRVS